MQDRRVAPRVGPSRDQEDVVSKRLRIFPQKRAAVMRAGSGACVYCGQPASTMEHLVPVHSGGTSRIDNLVPACVPCNRRKGCRSLDDFLNDMLPLEAHRAAERVAHALRRAKRAAR